MTKRAFKETWNRISLHEGNIFHTKSGLQFTYHLDGEGLIPSRTKYRISKTDIKKDQSMYPLKGPGVIRDIIRGPAYVWAILHDQRITSKG